MSKLSRALAITLLAASIPAGIVMAQQVEPSDTPAAVENDKPAGMSDETKSRLEDGRIAMAKAALKLTPEQEKLWAPLEEKIRANYAERSKMREEWRAKREERHAERDKRKDMSLPERVEQRSQRLAERATKMSERAERSKQLAAVLKPFYESLSDEQKEVATHVLRRFAHDGRGRHHGHRGHHGRRWSMGDMGPDGMGPGGMGHGWHGGRGHFPKDGSED